MDDTTEVPTPDSDGGARPERPPRRRLVVAGVLSVIALAATAVGATLLTRDGGLPPPEPPPDGFRLVGYWPNWTSADPEAPYRVRDLPATGLTAVNYFALGIDDAQCALTRPELDTNNLTALVELADEHPRMRAIASVIAYDGEGFSDTALDPEMRAAFVQSCVAIVDQFGLDGLDIDWEFPEVAERGAFTALVTELRAALGPDRVLTAAIPAWITANDRYDLAAVAQQLDWINLMAYDLRTPEDNDGITGPPAALRASVGVGRHTIETAVEHFLVNGVPSGKIVMGMPFYALRWAGVSDGGTGGLGQPTTGPADPQAVAVASIDRPAGIYDADAAQSYQFDAATSVFTGYDDERSVADKMDYVLERQLGGAMIWHLDFDDDDHTMLRAVTAALRGEDNEQLDIGSQ
jgi:chitinase